MVQNLRTRKCRPGFGTSKVSGLDFPLRSSPQASDSSPVPSKGIFDRRDAYERQDFRLGLAKYGSTAETHRDAFRHGYGAGAVAGPWPPVVGYGFIYTYNVVVEGLQFVGATVRDPRNVGDHFKSARNDIWNNLESLSLYHQLERKLGRPPTENEWGDRVNQEVKAGTLRYRDGPMSEKGNGQMQPLTGRYQGGYVGGHRYWSGTDSRYMPSPGGKGGGSRGGGHGPGSGDGTMMA